MKARTLKIIILFIILTLIPAFDFSSISSAANDTAKNTTSLVSSPVDNTTSYPRIFAEYLRNNIAHKGVTEELAKFDIVILSTRVPTEEITRLKNLNPKIKLGFYVTPVSVVNGAGGFPWEDDREKYNKVSAGNWWMHDVEGGNVVTYGDRKDKYFNIGVNFTPYCPKYEGQRFYDWFPEFLYKQIIQRRPDFLFVDEFFAGYSWLVNANGNKRIDIDNDGKPDSAAKVDGACREGLRIMFTRLRQLLQANHKDTVIIINGSHGGGYHDLFNGAERENYPDMHGRNDVYPNYYGYHWVDNMFNPDYGYLANDKLFKTPNFSLIAADPLFAWGGTQTQPPQNFYFEGRMRFAFGSCLLGDGYFGISNWSVAWWIDKYYTFNGKKGYLGKPLGNASQIIKERWQGERYGVYIRNFQKGAVLVNASGYTQCVELYKMRYKKVQDGSIVTGTTCIPPWDALILVRETNVK